MDSRVRKANIDLLVIMETTLRDHSKPYKIRQFLKPLFGLDIIVYPPAKIEQRLAWGDFFFKPEDSSNVGLFCYEN